MKKIRIGHDNAGLGPAWHLNRVEVTNLKTGEHRIFPANRWFSKSDDDFQIERDLFPGDAPDLNVEWEVVVVTSDIKGAGTDANVFVQMFGSEGAAATGVITLQRAVCGCACVTGSLPVCRRVWCWMPSMACLAGMLRRWSSSMWVG